LWRLKQGFAFRLTIADSGFFSPMQSGLNAAKIDIESGAMITLVEVTPEIETFLAPIDP
jgi:hypothetical protein